MAYYVTVDHQRKFNCRNGSGSLSRLNGNTPSQRYQKLKIINNTVRVPSSIYTMNLGALNTYQTPDFVYRQGVNWNQASDRKEPHIQPANSSGSNPGGNSTKRGCLPCYGPKCRFVCSKKWGNSGKRICSRFSILETDIEDASHQTGLATCAEMLHPELQSDRKVYGWIASW